MDFTYETENRAVPLETYEWDNVWWEKADDTDCPRALYIGDSISCGIRGYLNNAFGDQLHIDGFGTSKGIDNPYFKEAISNFGKQSGNKKLVMFNNGLHGWHLSTEQYGEYYEKMAEFLIKEFEGARLVLLTTTRTAEKNRIQLVLERNAEVRKIAERNSLPVIDLYDISKGLKQKDDGVHFVDDSYEKIAENLADEIKKLF